MNVEVLYEDEDTLVINKPFGVVVNRADSVVGETIQDVIEDKYKGHFEGVDDKVFLQRSGICHRLDKETSGCLLVAKNPDALYYYLKLFKERRIVKEYVALVHGEVDPKEGEVILPLKRNPFEKEKWGVRYDGKRAVTGWKVEKVFVYPDTPHWKNTLSLLRLSLKTGRTHQIRVHMSFLGWPLFSDAKYLNKEVAKMDRVLLTHHFLHAMYLDFVSFGGKRISVESPLPDDCETLLKGLLPA